MTKPKPQTVFRVEPAARKFTMISNDLLRDKRLSHETRGLLCELLSRPLDWEITVRGMIKDGPSGRDKVYRMIAEAERLGYIAREDQARGEDGRMGGTYYVVRDEPLTEKPDTVEPLPEKPHTAEPYTANPPQQKKERIQRQNLQKPSSAAGERPGYVEDDEGIRTGRFALSWEWVDAAADAAGVPSADARKLAKVLALELVAVPPNGTGYYATFRRMLAEHKRGARPSGKRQEAAAKPHWRQEREDATTAVRGAIARARALEQAAVQ